MSTHHTVYGKGGAQISTLPHLLPPNWSPEERLRQHQLLRVFENAEFEELVKEFRAFCALHRLMRRRWGHLLCNWLQHRQDPNWVPQRQEDR